MDARPRVVIIGGGVSGLATAYYLHQAPEAPAVTLIEADHRWGGKIRTHRVGALPVETGPDAFLARGAQLRALVDDLGLGERVTPPAVANSYVLSGGRLRPLPGGTMFGVPRRLLPVLRSRLLSPTGLARAGLDLVLPRREAPAGDPSVGALLRPRFGDQLVDRLIEPLLGGVHAGLVDQLSAASTVPDVAAVATASRSVYLGLRRHTRPGVRTGPGAGAAGLVTLLGGLGTLVDALRRALAGAELRSGTPAVAVDRDGDRYRIDLADGDVLAADAVVLATPAYAGADLLEALLPQAAAELRAIPYADVASVVLRYPHAALRRPLDATGFLVPPAEGRLLVGSSWLSSKWAHLSQPDAVLLRCQVGRAGDSRWLSMTSEALVDRVHEELADVLGLTERPSYAHVQRWPRGMPQYTTGHAERLARLDAALGKAPGLHLTGAAYRGIGLPGCVAQARATADRVLAGLAPAGGRGAAGAVGVGDDGPRTSGSGHEERT